MKLLNLNEIEFMQVKVWFQNRRTKYKRQCNEDKHSQQLHGKQSQDQETSEDSYEARKSIQSHKDQYSEDDAVDENCPEDMVVVDGEHFESAGGLNNVWFYIINASKIWC